MSDKFKENLLKAFLALPLKKQWNIWMMAVGLIGAYTIHVQPDAFGPWFKDLVSLLTVSEWLGSIALLSLWIKVKHLERELFWQKADCECDLGHFRTAVFDLAVICSSKGAQQEAQEVRKRLDENLENTRKERTRIRENR